ncbi:hypothetical protein GALLR39Z86_16170 [Glycomyces algeriensis]|uniref:Uncharacterized protein n=1 Tax=Glycomyces algeriensis TaxID=256037 RepID=A0A9W6G7I3_9ACTN|nr:hypothetical protein GALLR39Z86_16170 [Glycomyces algeriensis]
MRPDAGISVTRWFHFHPTPPVYLRIQPIRLYDRELTPSNPPLAQCRRIGPLRPMEASGIRHEPFAYAPNEEWRGHLESWGFVAIGAPSTAVLHSRVPPRGDIW